MHRSSFQMAWVHLPESQTLVIPSSEKNYSIKTHQILRRITQSFGYFSMFWRKIQCIFSRIHSDGSNTLSIQCSTLNTWNFYRFLLFQYNSFKSGRNSRKRQIALFLRWKYYFQNLLKYFCCQIKSSRRHLHVKKRSQTLKRIVINTL